MVLARPIDETQAVACNVSRTIAGRALQRARLEVKT